MKKVLLLSLSLVLGFSAFAQQRVAKSDLKSFTVNSKKVVVGNEVGTQSAAQFAPQTAKSVVVNRYQDCEDAETMYTYYDLQSNSWCSNRMYQLPNGNVGIVATLSLESNQDASDRGTGYNFYDAASQSWMDMPEARVESARCGWPTIAQWGDEGEILISHAPLSVYTREVAGQGEWVYRGSLPESPEGFEYADDFAWPRVATSGDHHNIIHVIGDIQHQVSSDEVHHWQVYLRSEDAENWTITYSPLAQDGEEYDHYTADSYNITANGHNVAMIYGDDLQSHVVMYKSTDDGLTWNRTVIWENPYYGYDWSTDEESIFTDTLFGPANLAIAIGPDGVAHVAMTVYEYIHDEIGNTYTTYSGRGVDGVFYWNDTQEAPIQSIDGNPHHALRLWWPDEENPQYVTMINDSTKWIGYLPLYQDEDGNVIAYVNDMFYRGDDYFYKFRSSQSATPALSIDPMGNIACAYSAPYVNPTEGDANYYRHIYVSYRNVDEGYWHQIVEELTDPLVEFAYGSSENIYAVSVDNTANPGEFWFGYQTDYQIGLYWGSGASQNTGSENFIHAVKVTPTPEMVSVPENNTVAQEVVYSIYPNPATDYVIVSSSADAEANITIFNLVGQTVKQFSKSLKTGENAISLDLNSGIYFCNIEANGYTKTIKFIVK